MITRSTDRNVKLLDAATILIQEVRADLAGAPIPPDGQTIRITAGQSIQSALDAAPAGTTFEIEPGTYDGAVKVTKAATFRAAILRRTGRASAETAVTLVSGSEHGTIWNAGTSITWAGIGVRNTNIDYDLVSCVGGSDVLLDQLALIGDVSRGGRRGVLLNDCSHVTVQRCLVDHIFQVGRETCCIGGWTGCHDLTIDDNYLCGGAEAIMFGGADALTADAIPSDIRITHNTLTKRPEWYQWGVQIKNALELKCALNVYIGDCLLEYGGTSEGQGAFLVLFTVRNQDGGAPWSTVRNVVMERCTARYGGGGLSIMGSDDQHPSETLENVTVRNCAFTDLDPYRYGGNGRCVQFSRGPKAVTLDALTFAGANLSALGYFPPDGEQPMALTLTNWKYPLTEYGWKIDAGGMDVPPASTHLQQYMPDLTYAITDHDPGAAHTP